MPENPDHPFAAQYESWGLPLAVLLGTPVAVFGAFAAIYFSGMENNVYVQIGLVMLIALGAKNAILIVEFAKAAADRGKRPWTRRWKGRGCGCVRF